VPIVAFANFASAVVPDGMPAGSQYEVTEKSTGFSGELPVIGPL